MKIYKGHIGKIEAEKEIKNILTNEGYSCEESKDISYGLQFQIEFAKEKVGTIRIYEKNNEETNIDISQITSEEQKNKLHNLISGKDIIHEGLDEINSSSEDIDLNSKSIIGIDESGKGDYFGPLVIGAVYVDFNDIKELSDIGVRDSKRISDEEIKKLYERIKGKCKIEFIKIDPQKYNELYGQINNLNHILAWGHARVLENMLSKIKCNYALSDQFGDKKLMESKLQQRGKNITLIQRPKAESNIAVAAASIVARNIFLEEMEKMSRIHKIKFPKGASVQVEKTALEFLEKKGGKELKKVAKLHFRTTEKILTFR